MLESHILSGMFFIELWERGESLWERKGIGREAVQGFTKTNREVAQCVPSWIRRERWRHGHNLEKHFSATM